MKKYLSDFASGPSTTVPTDDRLLTSPGNTSVNVPVNGAQGWGTLPAQGRLSAWPALGSEPAPDADGWLLDDTSLENGIIPAGRWSATISLSVLPSLAVVNGDIHVRASKRSSAGVFTTIVDLVLTGQTITNTNVTFSIPSANGPATSFAVGDKLFVDVLMNVTSSQTTSTLFYQEDSTATIVFPDVVQAGAPITLVTRSGQNTLRSRSGSTLKARSGAFTIRVR